MNRCWARKIRFDLISGAASREQRRIPHSGPARREGESDRRLDILEDRGFRSHRGSLLTGLQGGHRDTSSGTGCFPPSSLLPLFSSPHQGQSSLREEDQKAEETERPRAVKIKPEHLPLVPARMGGHPLGPPLPARSQDFSSSL